MIYLIGSLRNPFIPAIANALEDKLEIKVFADWFAAGPRTDDHWREYAKARGQKYTEALLEPHAVDVFQFDQIHLDMSDAAVLVLPAGKSGHLELGYMIGRGKPGWILLDGEPERWDIMYQFATGVATDTGELSDMIGKVMK